MVLIVVWELVLLGLMVFLATLIFVNVVKNVMVVRMILVGADLTVIQRKRNASMTVAPAITKIEQNIFTRKVAAYTMNLLIVVI